MVQQCASFASGTREGAPFYHIISWPWRAVEIQLPRCVMQVQSHSNEYKPYTLRRYANFW